MTVALCSPTPLAGRYGARTSRSGTFLPLLARLGLPSARWHDLRHMFVSRASAEGVPVQMISQMLGHSSLSMTQAVYTHILPGMGKVAAPAMERVLRGNDHGESRLPG
jgi:integrase